MGTFDSKTFNSEVFLRYLSTIPDTTKNELIKSGVLVRNENLKSALSAQVGGNYIVRPYKGLIAGVAQNYDGNTNITANTSTTYKQGIVVVGRQTGNTEKDFSYDITGGTDFMSNVAVQLAKFWENVDQTTILKILKGISGVPAFADHIYNANGEIGAVTINNATQKACGDNKRAFACAFMHSAVATQLENLQILEYVKFTDKQGITRSTTLATINGKVVFIDDSMPFVAVARTYVKTRDVAIDPAKDYYTNSGSTYTLVETPSLSDIATYYEVDVEAHNEYTTYILGAGAFEYCDVGVKVPVEMDRNPALAGGQDYLYSRQRKAFIPSGFSFDITNISSDSPTDAELEDSNNWAVVTDATGTETYPTKAIPICVIKSWVY